MCKWRGIFFVSVVLLVNISQYAYCATQRPSRSVVKSGTTTARNAASTINDTSSRVVARSATTATVQKNANSGTHVATRTGQNRAKTRAVVARNTTNTNTVEKTTVSSVIDAMTEQKNMTDFCKAQYTACMDNFCNVLDDNQGRCSCSANLSNYAETEAALKEATERLQDVAQQIQYIGLTADQVESLFTETAAEAESRIIWVNG